MSERELDQELGNNWKTEVWEGARLRQRAKVQSWERGIVEKELVKKDYRTVLEALDKVKVYCRHKDVLPLNISVSEICTSCGLCFRRVHPSLPSPTVHRRWCSLPTSSYFLSASSAISFAWAS